MDFSEYSPYETFDEFTINYQRRKHRELFSLRKDRIFGFLVRLYTSSPGVKVTAKYIANRYNKEKFESKSITIQIVSRVIHDLRLDGYKIHHDKKGYWYSDSDLDLVNTIVNFETQINAMRYTMQNLLVHISKEDYEKVLNIVLNKRVD